MGEGRLKERPDYIALTECDVVPCQGAVNIWTRLGKGEGAQYFVTIPAGTVVKIYITETRRGKTQWRFYDIPKDPSKPPCAVRVLPAGSPPEGTHVLEESLNYLIVRTPRSVLERALFCLSLCDSSPTEEDLVRAYLASKTFLTHLYLNDMAGEEVEKVLDKANKCLRLALDRGATQAEAERALTMALRMVRKEVERWRSLL